MIQAAAGCGGAKSIWDGKSHLDLKIALGPETSNGQVDRRQSHRMKELNASRVGTEALSEITASKWISYSYRYIHTASKLHIRSHVFSRLPKEFEITTRVT
jgi:hypothetical protein